MQERKGWIVVIGSLLITSASHAAIKNLVAFGDSLSDTGNVFANSGDTFPPTPPYADGNFTNGDNWVEHLADLLAHPQMQHLDPSLSGGTNYAWGGAETGLNVTQTITTSGIPFPGSFPVSAQVATYLGDVGGQVTKPNQTLFTYWAGANDFLLRNEQDPSLVVGNIANDLNALIAAGAKHLLVANLPALDFTPGGSGAVPSAFVTSASGTAAGPPPVPFNPRVVDFNTQLDAALDGIEASDPKVQIHRLDVFGLFNDVINEVLNGSGNFGGITNVTTPVIIEPLLLSGDPNFFTGADPDASLFWDTVHPTALGHQILGDVAYASLNTSSLVIPEPATAGLIAVAVGAGIGSRRRIAG